MCWRPFGLLHGRGAAEGFCLFTRRELAAGRMLHNRWPLVISQEECTTVTCVVLC